MAILQSFLRNSARKAVADAHGSYSYAEVLSGAVALKNLLTNEPSFPNGSSQPRVAYAIGRDHRYVVSKCATWLAGGIGVPIAENHPAEEIKYALQDSGATAVFVTADRRAVVQPMADALGLPVIEIPMVIPGNALDHATLEQSVAAAPGVLDSSHGAFLIYTSGTTGRPKGVLTTHAMLSAQVDAMGSAWEWKDTDRIYSVLPLHHVHGIVAIVLTALQHGGCVELAPRFDATASWNALTRPPPNNDAQAQVAPGKTQPTLFMAVPTVYAKMLEAAAKAGPEQAATWSSALKSPTSTVRLMVSGSAALPESVARAWKEATGHTLLERYGMTEFAMAVSNPLHGPRKMNTVGKPLPGYEFRVVPEVEGSDPKDGGELQITGPGVFTQYWGKPEATKETFSEDGWFKTGDRVIVDADGFIAIQGRLSADIIKCGGYKISALDIERELLEHPDLAEIAVVGVPDATWGEKVAAVVVMKNQAADSDPAEVLNKLRAFGAEKLAPYKLPSLVKLLPEIPRNAMGKVNKKALRKELFGV